MSKILDEQYLIEQLCAKARRIGGDTPGIYDEGEAKCFIKLILKCFNDLGYDIIQRIEFFKTEDSVNDDINKKDGIYPNSYDKQGGSQ